jgi:3-oxoacyl-[acyl-carrier protein] reductase
MNTAEAAEGKGTGMELQGKIVLITGGASGIGREAAFLMGGQGAEIIIADIQEKAGEAAVGAIKASGAVARFVKYDALDVSQVRRLVGEVAAAAGRIDVLVNCAGICPLAKVPDLQIDEWDRVMAVNLTSTFVACQEALRHMCAAGSGKIVNLASAAGKSGGAAVGAHYAASKAGVICLTKSLAVYGAPFGVNVNCVSPGPTETPMTDAWGEAINASMAGKIPLKRYARPAEVAEAILFLASDRAAYITGETLDVNGGLIMD